MNPDCPAVFDQKQLEAMAALLAEGNEVSLTPKGKSMLPFIQEGKDTVVLRKLPLVKKGDIVLARLPEHYVLHRVIAVGEETLTLMGDGNLHLKERCSREDVLGTVVQIERKGRKAHRPGRALLWRALLPCRRLLLALYRPFL